MQAVPSELISHIGAMLDTRDRRACLEAARLFGSVCADVCTAFRLDLQALAAQADPGERLARHLHYIARTRPSAECVWLHAAGLDDEPALEAVRRVLPALALRLREHVPGAQPGVHLVNCKLAQRLLDALAGAGLAPTRARLVALEPGVALPRLPPGAALRCLHTSTAALQPAGALPPAHELRLVVHALGLGRLDLTGRCAPAADVAVVSLHLLPLIEGCAHQVRQLALKHVVARDVFMAQLLEAYERAPLSGLRCLRLDPGANLCWHPDAPIRQFVLRALPAALRASGNCRVLVAAGHDASAIGFVRFLVEVARFPPRSVSLQCGDADEFAVARVLQLLLRRRAGWDVAPPWGVDRPAAESWPPAQEQRPSLHGLLARCRPRARFNLAFAETLPDWPEA